MTLLGDDTNCKVINMLAYWFSTQTIFLQVLILSNGTRQGGVCILLTVSLLCESD